MAMPGISESHYIDEMVIRCIAIKQRCFNWPYQLFRIPYPKPTFQASAMRWLSRSQLFNIYMLSCGCKTACACIRNCQCKNAGLIWINMCSGCGGRTCNNSDLNDDVVWAQSSHVYHARNVSALLDFNSFPEPHIHIQSFTPLPWGSVHHHDPYTLLCLYVKMLWSWQSSHGRGLKRWIHSGMGFRAIDMVNWNMYISSQCILLPSDWWSDSQWYPAWP